MIHQRRYGFSMLELMITLSIMGILLCFGAPFIGKTCQSQDVVNARKQLAYALKKSRYYARNKGITVSVDLTEGSNTFSVTADGTELTGESTLFDSFNGTFPEDLVVISSSCNDINFDINGFLIDSYDELITENCIITVGYSNGIQKNLTINTGTGNVNYD